MGTSHCRAEIAIVGIHPPPYGGVGVHLKRMVAYLDKQGIDYVFYNTGPAKAEHPRIVNVGWSLLWYLRLLLFGRHELIHSHTGRWWVRIGIGLLGMFRKRKIVFTAHSYSFCNDFLSGNAIRQWLQKLVLRRASAIISVNNAIREELLKIGVSEQVIHVIPAFIPPPFDEGDNTVPTEMKEFCKGKSPVLVANGAFILRNGQDIYGLEIMVNMMESLLKIYPNAGLIICLGGMLGSDENQFKGLVWGVETSVLKSHILFYTSKEEFYPVLRIADVFLRPTLTDGDAVSVREALYLGVPVVASNAVQRPKQAVVFCTGDQEAFYNTVIEVLAKIEEYKEQLKGVRWGNPADEVLSVYQKLYQ